MKTFAFWNLRNTVLQGGKSKLGLYATSVQSFVAHPEAEARRGLIDTEEVPSFMAASAHNKIVFYAPFSISSHRINIAAANGIEIRRHL